MVKANNDSDKSDSSELLTKPQLRTLLDYVINRANIARQTGAKRAIIDEMVILLLSETGLRPEEFCNLCIEDLPCSHEKSVIVIRDSAGNVSREVEISSNVAERIKRYVLLYRKSAGPKEPFLASERGNRFSYRSLYHKVRKIGENAGVGSLYPSMLRGAYIIRLYDEVKDLRLVQQQVGHASPKTTAMYIKKNSQHKTKESDSSETDYEAEETKDTITEKDSFKCDACERLIQGKGKKIDSGQILCDNCHKYFS